MVTGFFAQWVPARVLAIQGTAGEMTGAARALYADG